MSTHEAYIAAVAAIVRGRAAQEDRAKLDAIKLVYGAGPAGTRGVTYFNRWRPASGDGEGVPFVEICAFGQENRTQVAGTVIHELAHVCAGWGAGHGPEWKAACERLGLRRALAGGTRYTWAHFAPDIRAAILALPAPQEGEPARDLTGWGAPGPLGGPGWAKRAMPKVKPCGAGYGTRGGTSRGTGSGSRNRLYHCACEPPVKVRHGGKGLRAHCDYCRGPFTLVGE